jgi:hypothetical protein
MSGFKGYGGRGGGGWSGGRGTGPGQKHPNAGNGGPSQKKFRGGDDDDDDPMLDDVFDDDDDLLGGGQLPMEVEELGQDVEMERAKSWRRPEPPPHDPTTQSLVFQQIETDFYVGENSLVSLSLTLIKARQFASG